MEKARTNISLKEVLAARIGVREIRYVCALYSGDDRAFEELYDYSLSDDLRLSYNALWVFTHFRRDDFRLLRTRRDHLISRVIAEPHSGKRRLMLNLLSRLRWSEDEFRTDFLDFCMEKMLSQTEPYGVRALCLRMAFEQCRFYPELLAELQVAIGMMADASLSPGLKATVRAVTAQMALS